MTAVATSIDQGRAVAVPAAANQTEAQKKAHQITEIDRLCVAPVRQARALWFGNNEGFSVALGARQETRYFCAEKFVAELPEDQRQSHRRYLEGQVAKIHPRADLELVMRTLQEAWSAKPSRNRTGIILGRLIDSFPNARPHNATTYRENLVHLCEVDGYSPAVVALACDRIMRDEAHQFLPAPAAFLAVCKDEFKNLQASHRHAWKALDGRLRFETVLAQIAAAESGTAADLPMDPDEAMMPPSEPTRQMF